MLKGQLYKTLPHALHRVPDNDFHERISALDLIRMGGSREVKVGQTLLEKKIWV